MEEKRRFFEEHLRELDLGVMIERSVGGRDFDELSPAGNLAGIRCPVTLIHDRNDAVVPSSQSERLFAELPEVAGRDRHRFVVTSVLSHVSPTNVLRVHELGALAGAIAPILREV